METKRANASSKGLISYIFKFLLIMTILLVFDLPLKYCVAIASLILIVMVGNKNSELMIALIFALTPLQQSLPVRGPIKFCISDLLMAFAMLIMLLRKDRKSEMTLGPITYPVIMYFGICLYSSMFYWKGTYAIISIIQMFLYMVCAVIIFSSFVRKEQNIDLTFTYFLVTCSFLAISVPFFGNLGLNKNSLGSSFASGTLVAIELWLNASNKNRKAFFLIALVIISSGLLFTLSRGAWAGAIAGVALILLMRRKFKVVIGMTIILSITIFICIQYLPQKSKDYAFSYGPETYSAKMRAINTNIAKKNYLKHPIEGNGVGLRKEYDATNLVWTVLAETGILGLSTFSLIFICFFIMVWRTQKRLSRNERLYSILIIGAALATNRLVHGMIDHYWSRGASTAAWTGTGMAIGVYLACKDIKRKGKCREDSASVPRMP